MTQDSRTRRIALLLWEGDGTATSRTLPPPSYPPLARTYYACALSTSAAISTNLTVGRTP